MARGMDKGGGDENLLLFWLEMFGVRGWMNNLFCWL